MSEWELFATDRALKDLDRLSDRDRKRVVSALQRLADSGHGDVRRLQNVDPPEWRLRVGDVRARFAYDQEKREITVLRVLPRGKAYDR